MRISVIITVLNEQETIISLLDALNNQTLKPNEIIICDGGSTDNTVKLIKKYKNIKLLIKKGNRSVSRNFAISKSKNDWIAITDAGCIPDKNWLKNLSLKQQETKAPVIAGYYQGLAKTNFQKAVIPYALVMPSKLNHDNFLPATRSMLIHKKVWEKLKGFDEKLSYNEDYDFALRIKNNNFTIAFAKNAVVSWMPRKNLFEFNKMIFNFAKGDIQAKIIRPKVILIFIRYLIGLGLFLYGAAEGRADLVILSSCLLVIYLLWSITKNIKHAKQGWFYLPILQINSDLMVMIGSLAGLFS